MWHGQTILPARVRRRRRAIWRSVAATIGIIVAASVLWANTQTTNPIQALQRASRIIEKHPAVDKEQLEEAQSLLAISSREPALRDWSTLLQGVALERLSQFAAARKAYSSVSPSSAPSLDARLGLTRLTIREDEQPTALLDELTQLQHLARNARRSDLESEAMYHHSRVQYKLGNLQSALAAIQQLRERFPKSSRIEESRDFAKKISLQLRTTAPSEEARGLLIEARLLFQEGEFSQALVPLEQIRKLLPPSDRVSWESLALQEKVLRKLKRHEEADALLIEIGGAPLEGLSDNALLQTAKNAWNINDHHRALEFLERLQTRFPSSPLKEESLYIEGRVLEEMNLLQEAKDTYLRLAEGSESGEFSFLATKRLAWLYYLNDDFEHAAQYFLRLVQKSDQKFEELRAAAEPSLLRWILNSEEVIALRRATEVREDRYHGMYWYAISLEKLPTELRRRFGEAWSNPDTLLDQLHREQPFGYYGLLAREKRGHHTPSIDYGAGSREGCGTTLSESALERFQIYFRSPELAAFAVREVDWFFTDPEHTGLDLPGSPSLFPVDTFAVRAELYQRTENTYRAVETAEHMLRRLDLFQPSEFFPSHVIESCRRRLLPFSYPRFQKALFEAAEKKRGVSRALLYGISRSESYFNPNAESIVGAQGLMQLMPETAKREGWNGKDDLRGVELNLDLGAKHLARLIAEYHGELPAAIAAYNAGGTAVNRWRTRSPNLPAPVWIELISYPETNKYVKRVLASQATYSTKEMRSSATP